jgi:hypothetical protein
MIGTRLVTNLSFNLLSKFAYGVFCLVGNQDQIFKFNDPINVENDPDT